LPLLLPLTTEVHSWFMLLLLLPFAAEVTAGSPCFFFLLLKFTATSF
jgi:hypothetical protein